MSQTADATQPGLRIKTDVEFAKPGGEQAARETAIAIRDASLFYGAKQALFDISMDIAARLREFDVGLDAQPRLGRIGGL
jgi:hypothetical protein